MGSKGQFAERRADLGRIEIRALMIAPGGLAKSRFCLFRDHRAFLAGFILISTTTLVQRSRTWVIIRFVGQILGSKVLSRTFLIFPGDCSDASASMLVRQIRGENIGKAQNVLQSQERAIFSFSSMAQAEH
jgi:hypothetical protein